MFLKLNLHLFRKKKIKNCMKNERFIKYLGFTGKFAKTCYKQNLFPTFDHKTQ